MKSGLISYAQALDRIHGLSVNCHETTIEIDKTPDLACGRVLAKPVTLAQDQPPFDRATMDGYALIPSPDRRQFSVIGTTMAGGIGVNPELGQAVRIMTGAVVPDGCGVVPIEATDGGKEVVNLKSSLTHRANVAFRGEDGRKGELAAPPGTVLTAVTMACLAMAGAQSLTVVSPPRLTAVITGDELSAEAQPESRVIDCHGPFLSGFAATLGLSLNKHYCRDDVDSLTTLLDAILEQHATDVLLLTGGVSMGDKDVVAKALQNIGVEVLFHGIDMQPGKPVLVGRRGSMLVAGLPGNPVSVVATAHLIVLPLLTRFGLPTPHWLGLPMAMAIEPKPRQRFLPARLTEVDTSTERGVMIMPSHGSGDLFAAARGHGLVSIPGGARLDVGQNVAFLPYVGSVTNGTGWRR